MARSDRRRLDDDRGSPVATFFVKAGSKLLLGIIIVLAFLTIAQCTVKSPESPSWSARFVVPVVNRTYPMQELIDRMDEEGLSINDSGDVVLNLTEELDTVSLDNTSLSTDDLRYVVSETLGPVNLDRPSPPSVTIAFADLGNLGLPFPGDSALVPDTTFLVETPLSQITTFSAATLSRGWLDVTVRNELGLTLDSITLDLVDAATNIVIASGDCRTPLPTYLQAIVPIILDGTSVSDALKIVARYHTSATTVRSASSRYIQHSFAFGDTLQAVSATACIPALSRTDSATVALAETDRIDSALLATGTLNLNIDNASNLDANVTVTAPDFSWYGQPLILTTPVPARSQTSVSVDVSGYALVTTSMTLPQQLQVVATAAMPGSGTTQVTVTHTDSFTVAARLSNLTFQSVTGLFQSVSANFDGISQDLQIPAGLENVQLTNAVVTLEIENAIDLPGTVDIRLTGDNGEQTAFVSNIAPRGLATTAVTTTIVNDSVADFLSPLPSRIDVSGSVSFGNGTYYGTITRDDFVVGRVHLFSPLEMVINPTTVETEIESEDIDQSDIDAITEHFISGRFVYRLTSHLPIGAHINVFLAGDSTVLFSDPQLRFDSLSLAAAPVGPAGIVIDTIQSAEQEIFLDSVDIKILENPVLYVGHEILLAGSDGQVVKLTADDFLSITGRIEVEYLFNGEF